MKPVYINGIGILSRCAQNIDELIQAVTGEKTNFTDFSERIPFQSAVPSSKLRRCSRYTKMAVSAAVLAVNDSHCAEENPENIGTILSTGYGALESYATFADSVVKGEPALCSPTVFSSTVPNSCVGQICIVNGFKGFSTILTGGDPIEYSALLLHTKRAENILCGSVEEYNEELEKSVRCSDISKDISISEGAAMLMLSAQPAESTYCRVTNFSSVSLPAYPYLHNINAAYAEKLLTEVFTEIAAVKAPDLILTQSNGTYFNDIERKAIEKVFGEQCKTYAPKKLFGETFGCGYLLNVSLAAALLQSGTLSSGGVLAAGMDANGNYLTALLEV